MNNAKPLILLTLLLLTPFFGWAGDMDRDGFPDITELTNEVDRVRFRRWFTAIAQSQFYALHPQWPQIRRDCAGLICFAYKEALKVHDKDWLKSYKYLTDAAIPDIKAFHYPAVPLLGQRLFRVSDGEFGPIATARVLMQYNCRFLGKQANEHLQPGDLLFYRYQKPDGLEDLYHAMILTAVTAGGDGVAVYHTGPEGDNPGEVRRVRLSALNSHPDDTWHVSPGNPRFLGYYRLHILDYKVIK